MQEKLTLTKKFHLYSILNNRIVHHASFTTYQQADREKTKTGSMVYFVSSIPPSDTEALNKKYGYRLSEFAS